MKKLLFSLLITASCFTVHAQSSLIFQGYHQAGSLFCFLYTAGHGFDPSEFNSVHHGQRSGFLCGNSTQTGSELHAHQRGN